MITGVLREFWRPWLFAVVLPLAFCLVLLLWQATPDNPRFGPVDFWLRRYQALVAGVLGLAGGLIAFFGVRSQERSDRDRWSTDHRLEMVGLAVLLENDLRAWIPRIDEVRALAHATDMEMQFPPAILEAIPRLHKLRSPGNTLLQAIGFLNAHNVLIARQAEQQDAVVDADVLNELRDNARNRLAIIRDMSTAALDEIHQITSTEHRFLF